MDSASQRTYITRRVKEELCLSTKQTEFLWIKTIGSADGQGTTCEVVQLGLLMKDGEMLKLIALVVPFICNPLTSQAISYS